MTTKTRIDKLEKRRQGHKIIVLCDCALFENSQVCDHARQVETLEKQGKKVMFITFTDGEAQP